MCMAELNVIQFVILQANWNIQTKGYIFKKGVNAQWNWLEPFSIKFVHIKHLPIFVWNRLSFLATMVSNNVAGLLSSECKIMF